MPDAYEPWGPKGGEMWLSTRELSHDGDIESIYRLRTVDERHNTTVEGRFVVNSLDEGWELLDVKKWLSKPVPEVQYTLLFMDAEASSSLTDHPRLKLLGYDLTDEHWSWSTLQDPCMWAGDLRAVAMRRRENGLLDFADARLAQDLFRKAWPGIAQFSVWALFEVVHEIEYHTAHTETPID
jgi:hypothetical protein